MRPTLIGGDEPHDALMAHSLAVDGDVELDDQYEAVAGGSKAAGRKFAGKTLEQHWRSGEGRAVFSHPLGLPLPAARLVYVKERVAPGASPDLISGGMTVATTLAALLAALQLMVGAGWVRAGVAAVGSLYLSTPQWSSSRTFFTEPYLWAFSVFSLYAFAGKRWILAASMLSALVLLEESSVHSVAAVIPGVLLACGWARSAVVAVGPLVAARVFFVANVFVYGKAWGTFQPFPLGKSWKDWRGRSSTPLTVLLPLFRWRWLRWWVGRGRWLAGVRRVLPT